LATIEEDDDRIGSVKFIEVLLDLLGGQHLELTVFSDHSNLDVILAHLPLETLFQGQQGSVNCVLNLHICLVSFLQEYLCVFRVLSDSRGFPVVIGTGGVDLGQMRPFLVISSDQD
jgi:hypothetical protein